MTRITKNLAKILSMELTESKRKKLEKRVLKLAVDFKKAHNKSLPIAVKRAKAKHPEYFSHRQSIVHLGSIPYPFDASFVPAACKKEDYRSIRIEDPESIPDWVDSDMLDDYKNLSYECREFISKRQEIRLYLLSLKSTTKLKEAFPEAYKLLPDLTKKETDPESIKTEELIDWLKE